MAVNWFVQVDDRIEGPLSAEEVRTRLHSGRLTSRHLIWGAGMEHWRNLGWWSNEGATLTDIVAVEPPKEIWHYALNGASFGPFSRDQLIDELVKMESTSDVLLWTKGMKEWVSIFEFHDILSSIGVNKRVYPRADLDGKVIIRTQETTITAQALTISEGGMGVVLDSGVSPGMNVSVEIQSSVFHAPIHVKADVRYVAGGITGLKFTNLNSESKSSIISYVRQSHTRFVLKAA